MEQLCNGYRASFWGDGNLLERERVVAQYYECTKCFPLKRLTLYYMNLTSFKNKKGSQGLGRSTVHLKSSKTLSLFPRAEDPEAAEQNA